MTACSVSAQQPKNVQKDAAGALTEAFNSARAHLMLSGGSVTFQSGSTLTLNGSLGGTPTGGTLDLSNLSLSLGTISTGTWNATAIATSKGGVPTGGSTGQVLAKASGTNYDVEWADVSAGGSGTVTSFSAGDLSPLFTTSEANATTTPALSFTLSNAAQNAIFAGPGTGGSGAPSYRALVALDIPTLTLSKISDAGDAAALDVGTTTGTVAAGDDSRIVNAVPNTRTVNGQALSGNVTLTTADVADSSNKRYVTDAQLTVLGNTSGTNTGDQNLFGSVVVSGQTTVTPGSTAQALTLAEGSNVTITTNNTTKTITIAASGGGGGGTWGSITGTLSDQTDLQSALDAKVATTLTISTTSPLSGGGDLSANRTLTIADAAADGSTKGAASFTAADFDASSGNVAIDYTNGQAASGSTKGFLSSTDWTTFNGKEPAISSGTTAQYWRGDKSWQPLDNAAVGLDNVENTALSTWAGSSSLTTLGTVTTGTWSATAIAASKGGVPTGGSTGQALVKVSGSNYDATWSDPFPAPFYVAAKNLSIATSGSPADIGSISVTLPPGTSRWILGGAWVPSGPSSYQPSFAVNESGGAITGTLSVFTAAGGSGSNIASAGSTWGSTAGTLTPLAAFSAANPPVRTDSTLYIRQTADSAVAGTISIYLQIVPLP